jgi:hypothetical protein
MGIIATTGRPPRVTNAALPDRCTESTTRLVLRASSRMFTTAIRSSICTSVCQTSYQAGAGLLDEAHVIRHQGRAVSSIARREPPAPASDRTSRTRPAVRARRSRAPSQGAARPSPAADDGSRAPRPCAEAQVHVQGLHRAPHLIERADRRGGIDPTGFGPARDRGPALRVRDHRAHRVLGRGDECIDRVAPPSSTTSFTRAFVSGLRITRGREARCR